MKRSGIDQSTLDDIIQRIVEVAEPEKIILFGSAARGDMNRHSDVDLLIIKDGADALDLMGEIYMNLDGVGAAVDAVVVTSDDVERYKDSHAVIIKPALSEGRVVYESS
ncbi:MAG: nucleotidyltransferase domain-containing protein [Gemmatimonadota bacterium]|nr:nucleotidyltransferase domain-containing protein [Gemmatimonadota bacterium]